MVSFYFIFSFFVFFMRIQMVSCYTIIRIKFTVGFALTTTKLHIHCIANISQVQGTN